MNFSVQIWCVVSEAMSFETITPIWSHVNENVCSPADSRRLKLGSKILQRNKYATISLKILCPKFQ